MRLTALLLGHKHAHVTSCYASTLRFDLGFRSFFYAIAGDYPPKAFRFRAAHVCSTVCVIIH